MYSTINFLLFSNVIVLQCIHKLFAFSIFITNFFSQHDLNFLLVMLIYLMYRSSSGFSISIFFCTIFISFSCCYCHYLLFIHDFCSTVCIYIVMYWAEYYQLLLQCFSTFLPFPLVFFCLLLVSFTLQDLFASWFDLYSCFFFWLFHDYRVTPFYFPVTASLCLWSERAVILLCISFHCIWLVLSDSLLFLVSSYSDALPIQTLVFSLLTC